MHHVLDAHALLGRHWWKVRWEYDREPRKGLSNYGYGIRLYPFTSLVTK